MGEEIFDKLEKKPEKKGKKEDKKKKPNQNIHDSNGDVPG